MIHDDSRTKTLSHLCYLKSFGLILFHHPPSHFHSFSNFKVKPFIWVKRCLWKWDIQKDFYDHLRISMNHSNYIIVWENISDIYKYLHRTTIVSLISNQTSANHVGQDCRKAPQRISPPKRSLYTALFPPYQYITNPNNALL